MYALSIIVQPAFIVPVLSAANMHFAMNKKAYLLCISDGDLSRMAAAFMAKQINGACRAC